MSTNGYFPTESELALSGAAQLVFPEGTAATTHKRFGKDVFVRTVVEVSNFCRENCACCGVRRDHRSLARYSAKMEQIAELVIQHRSASVTDVNIQAGEDPVVVREVVLPLIETLRRETSPGVSVCLGTLARELYAELQSAGANLVTINLTPADVREDYVIYKRDRFIMTEERALAAEGLAPSKQGLADFYPGRTASGIVPRNISETLVQM